MYIPHEVIKQIAASIVEEGAVNGERHDVARRILIDKYSTVLDSDVRRATRLASWEIQEMKLKESK